MNIEVSTQRPYITTYLRQPLVLLYGKGKMLKICNT